MSGLGKREKGPDFQLWPKTRYYGDQASLDFYHVPELWRWSG
jgi:hypothetical protein